MNMHFLFMMLSLTQILSKQIFEETKIKNIKFKNRLFKGSVFDFTFKDGKMTEEGLKYYEEYAMNGVGSIITGGTLVDSNYKLTSGYFVIDDDKYIPEYQKLTSLMHKYDTKIFPQIAPSGFNSEGKLIGPSKLYNSFYKQELIEMTKEEILSIEDAVANGSLRAKKAGFDGVELGAGHWGLYGLFFSPHYNKRNDEYGGTAENMARFMVETVEKIRKVVGNDFVIIIKLNCRESFEDSFTVDDFITYCKLAEKAGVDIIEVSSGDYREVKAKELNGRPFYLDYTVKASENVNIPVMLIGGIRDLDTIENVMKNTKIEYFGLCRPLMCEPDLPKYWKEKGNRKSKCISCNGCFKKHACVFKDKNKKKNLKE